MIESVAMNSVKEVSVESLKMVETRVKESPVQNMIETIESSSLESIEANNIETINSRFEGMLHPETDVPYERKLVENSNGEIVDGIFPDFKEHRVFQVELPSDLHQVSDYKQFDYCNNKLSESFEKGTIKIENLSPRQLDQLRNGDKADGLTWHHNEFKGRMELVDSKTHDLARHTGGKSIWGGGSEAR